MGKISPCARFHDEILELNRQGVGHLAIAVRLGLPGKKLMSYLEHRGIRSPISHEDRRRRIDRDEVRRLIEDEHLTLEQVAAHFGSPRSTIDRIVAKKGLKTARRGPRSGAGHQEWKGGRVLDKHGYVEVYAPLHPASRKGTGRVLEHRLVAEVKLGRYLQADEAVDHQDDHPRHNWPDNLEVYTSNADHLRATLTGREKATPRSSIPGAYGSNQSIDHCPGPDETLALCRPEVRRMIERHILIHQPTTEHRALPKSRLLRSGALQPPFPPRSTE